MIGHVSKCPPRQGLRGLINGFNSAESLVAAKYKGRAHPSASDDFRNPNQVWLTSLGYSLAYTL